MKSIIKKLRKIVAVTVSVTTIASTLGLAALTPFAATAATAGDLVKQAGSSSVYYVGSDSKRYVFPSQSVFDAWYPGGASVTTLSSADLLALDLGGNVTMRAGTKLVQIVTNDTPWQVADAKVYAVSPNGTKHHITSAAAAVALYGANWESKIAPVTEAIASNYTAGADLDGTKYPEGALVLQGSDIFYVKADGTGRKVLADGLTANRLSSANTVSGTLTVVNASSDLNSAESDLTDISGGASVGPISGNSLTAALSANTPASVVVPQNAARVPFVKVNLTAASDGDVIVKSLTVERKNLATDSNFSSLSLIDDSTGLQVGLTKTLNSNHQATFTDDLTIKAGKTQSYTIAGNMAATLQGGETPSLAVVAIETDATVTGTLPITGNAMTMNSTITIGSVSIQRGSYENATSTSLEVGKTDYVFASYKVTAGSAEDVEVSSIKFYQSGTVSQATDLKNAKLYVDSSTLLSSAATFDGKYLTFSYSPVSIGKGLNKEFTLKADVESGSTRTVKFGIYRTTDVVVKGKTYNYGLTPTFTGTGSSGNSPVLDSNQFTISTGTLRIERSTIVGSNNVTTATGQELGAFNYVVKGEPINVTQTVITLVSSSSTAVYGHRQAVTNVKLVDSAGKTIAGPTDPATASGVVTFSDSYTLPIGETAYKVVADIAANKDIAANTTFYATITPSTGITATGGTTGDAPTVTPTTAQNTNTQTAKVASLVVTKDSTPVSQTVIAGQQALVLGKWTLDATNSGENIRITQFALRHYASTTNIDNLTLYDGTTALSPVIEGNSVSASPYMGTSTFTLTDALIVTKGTSKSISLKGTVRAASGVYPRMDTHGITSSAGVTASGAATNNTVTASVTSNDGAAMTIQTAGALTVTNDASSPSASLKSAGSTGVTVGVVKINADYEAVDMDTITVDLRGSTVAGNAGTASDITMVYVYDGATLVASANIPAGQNRKTFTLDNNTLVIPKDGEKILTIKADLATVGTTESSGTAGNSITLGFGGANGFSGTGVASQTAATETYSSSTSSAVTIYKSVPTITSMSLPTQTLTNDTDAVLYRFTVSADAKGNIALYKMSFNIATSTGVDVDNAYIWSVSDSKRWSALTTVDGSNQATIGIVLDNPDTSTLTKESYLVQAGVTKTFDLRASVTVSGTGRSVNTKLLGSTAKSTTVMDTADNAAGYHPNDKFIWGDQHISGGTLATTNTAQFVNGYLVSGLDATSTAKSLVN